MPRAKKSTLNLSEKDLVQTVFIKAKQSLETLPYALVRKLPPASQRAIDFAIDDLKKALDALPIIIEPELEEVAN